MPELKNDKAFAKAVKNGTYDRWAMDMSALFGRKGIKGTPNFMHGDKKLVMDQVPQRRMTQAQYNQLALDNFRKMIDKEFGPAKGPDTGKDSGKSGGKGIREGEKDPSGTR